MAAQPIPPSAKCPTCNAGSHAINRITGSKKALHGFAFGILAAGTLKSTFKCTACGYKW